MKSHHFTFRTLSLAVVGFGLLAWLLRGGDLVSAQEEPAGCEIPEVTFNALDYQQTLYDFSSGELRASRQIDSKLREYPGDLLFDGNDFTLIDTYDRSGLLVDLGKSAEADSEFSLFYGLRQYKRHLQKNRFPYTGDFVTFAGLDRDLFFGRPVDGFQQQRIHLGHTYALRLAHRTRVGDERLLLLRIIDFTPGVRVTMQWRELPNEGTAEG